MRTIQEVGYEILNKTPRKFYVMCGSEYGVKKKYLQILSEIYSEVHEVPDVQSILDMMNTKHFIPLTPALYIVRYDETFLSSLNATTSDKIDHTNIIGTIVCIYDDSAKTSNKLDKYLPDWSISIDNIDKQFVMKYLRSDFPSLPDRMVSIAALNCANYGDAQQVCTSMSLAPEAELNSMSDAEIITLFGKQTVSKESEIRKAVAARNFTYLIELLDNYPGEYDSVFYVILSTMTELEKIMPNKYAESDLKPYTKQWTYKDIYNMFMNTYEELKKLRSYATNAEASLIYLFSLLKFSEIPDVEVMQ